MIFLLLFCVFLIFQQLIYNKCTNFQVLTFENITFDFIYFAADEKTEDPTPKKIKDSRSKGQVAKSPDLNSATILIIIGLLASFSGNSAYKKMYSFLYTSLRNINTDIANIGIRSVFTYNVYWFFSITAIVFMTVMFGGIIANLVQSGFLFTLEPLKMSFKKLNPIEGVKNQFSKRALFNLVKTLSKLIVVVYIAYGFIKSNIFNIYQLTTVDLSQIYPYMKNLLTNLTFRIAIVLLILGIVDLVFQKYDHKKNLKMTKNEIKEELKQMEGDQHLKSQRKQKQRQIASARMMADVPKSTMIITNPTHIAVAIKYEDEIDQAPIITAMGVDHVALKIREIAEHHNIPIIENKPLARMLLKKSKIGKHVPVELYRTIAELLAQIYILNKKRYYKR